MTWNHMALLVSIFTGASPEDAFHMLETGQKRKKRQYRKLTKRELEHIMHLKQTHTYEEIANMYGMSRAAVANRVHRYRRELLGQGGSERQ